MFKKLIVGLMLIFATAAVAANGEVIHKGKILGKANVDRAVFVFNDETAIDRACLVIVMEGEALSVCTTYERINQILTNINQSIKEEK